MLDQQRQLIKLIDFGFATMIDDELLHERTGTEGYMAPELHYRQPYDGRAVDVFALAVTLFKMVVGHEPFENSKPEKKNLVYMCIAENRTELFWSFHCKSKKTTKSKTNDSEL